MIDLPETVRDALFRLKEELELKQSADLYAEIYEKDTELRELNETAEKDGMK
jgi:hypothetical protein